MDSTSSNRKVKAFRGKQEIESLLAKHAQSGQSVRVFCAGLHIAEGTFYHWKKKFSKDIGATGKGGFYKRSWVVEFRNT